jgi:hypothetical protein
VVLILIIQSGNANSADTIRDISSWIVYDRCAAPAWGGLEYLMPGGTAWTLASANDQYFYKILLNSGVLHTEIGHSPGTTGLLCTPVLGRGVPRYFEGVTSFLACAGDGTPFFYASQENNGTIRGLHCNDVGFRNIISSL